MLLRHAFLVGALIVASSSALGQPQPLGEIWRNNRGSVFLTECPPGGDHDDFCRAVKIRRGKDVIDLGGGYMAVTIFWSRKSEASGPDVLVLGDDGGSGGDGDLFAVTFSSRIAVRKLDGERIDSVAIRAGSGRLRLDLPFDIEYFNGAPHAGAITVPVPAHWVDGDFALDLTKLTSRTYSKSEFDFRVLAASQELRTWASDQYPATRLYPQEARSGTPVSATAIVEMMLSGHADQAYVLLDRAWPRIGGAGQQLGGKNAYWNALCRAVAGNPYWQRFSLARLPHADLIESGATGAG